jgi:hypothetical protein
MIKIKDNPSQDSILGTGSHFVRGTNKLLSANEIAMTGTALCKGGRNKEGLPTQINHI